jgi:hypothetical protein
MDVLSIVSLAAVCAAAAFASRAISFDGLNVVSGMIKSTTRFSRQSLDQQTGFKSVFIGFGRDFPDFWSSDLWTRKISTKHRHHQQ